MNTAKRAERARHKKKMNEKLRKANLARATNKKGKERIPAWPKGSDKVGKFK